MKTGDYIYFYYYCAFMTIFTICIRLTIVPVENTIPYFQNFLCIVKRQVSGVKLLGFVPSLGRVILGKLLNLSLPQCTYL